MEEALLIHENVVPVTVAANPEGLTTEPEHTVILSGWAIPGVGSTNILNVLDTPGQLLAIAVTVILADTVVLEGFTAVKDGIFPDPLAANPMAVLSFVQL